MRAGTMPHSLTRAEDWARAETFAKRTSFHYRISAEPEQPFGSANYPDGVWASWKAARDGKIVFTGAIRLGCAEGLFSLGLIDVVDCDDVGIIQRGNRARLEAHGPTATIVGERSFETPLPSQPIRQARPPITSPNHIAHAVPTR